MKSLYEKIKNMRLSQNKFEMASIVSFQIEVICIFFQKEEFTSSFLKILSIQTVFSLP